MISAWSTSFHRVKSQWSVPEALAGMQHKVAEPGGVQPMVAEQGDKEQGRLEWLDYFMIVLV